MAVHNLRIVCISDTHGAHRTVNLPEGDVLIHAGDILRGYRPEQELEDFDAWLAENSGKHRHRVVIAGNHDRMFQGRPSSARKRLKNAVYLENTAFEIEGIKFYGSPQTPEFMDWAFNVPRGEAIRRYWNSIPEDTNVLITHGPPMGILDMARPMGEHLGCDDLYDAVEQLGPLLHVFGHIHGGYGKHHQGGTVFVNAAIMNEAYRPVNLPIVVDVEKEV